MRQVLAVWFGGDVSAHQWFLFQPMVFLSLLGIFTSTLLMQCRTFSSFRTLWREFPARSLQWQPPLWELRRLPSSSPLWSRYTASRGTIAYDILSHARHARLNDADSMKGHVSGYTQIVLDILTQNVSRGSPVYEEGHILLLAWACTQAGPGRSSGSASPRQGTLACQHAIMLGADWIEHATTSNILAQSSMCIGACAQLCLAYRNEGGRVIVVLSGVPKTEMEETFKHIIGIADRYGSSFVFRCDLAPTACCLLVVMKGISLFAPHRPWLLELLQQSQCIRQARQTRCCRRICAWLQPPRLLLRSSSQTRPGGLSLPLTSTALGDGRGLADSQQRAALTS